MIAFVGLGNPTEEYFQTRHNAGFAVIDKLADDFNATYWKDECGAKVAHCKVPSAPDGEVLLAKPQSFMNLSGGPVKKLLEKYNISVNNIVIIHDDMDITGGNIKVKKGGSSAGHNGLKSITQKLGNSNYIRIRVGIERPPGRMPFANYVLSVPKGRQAQDFEKSCEKAADAARFFLTHTLDHVQQEFNSKN